MTAHLTTAQSDRAAGVLLGLAAGDALGAGYEFGPPLDDDVEVEMAGGGALGWAAGEWTDDTSMAVAIAEVSAEGLDLRTDAAQDRIAAGWAGWARGAKDVGVQTRQVLSAAGRGGADPTAAELRAASLDLHEQTGRTAGNGSLMRTAPVALAYLDDPDALVAAAGGISAVTHTDPEAGEACALWCLAIRHAVLEGTFEGLGEALTWLPSFRRDVWASRLRTAEQQPPASFTHNGWVVEALQGAWSAITRTPVPPGQSGVGSPADHLRLALAAAVRGGRDTDTVAAIAGALLGARWGASAVPSVWRRRLHGWPGLRARDLCGWVCSPRVADVRTARVGRASLRWTTAGGPTATPWCGIPTTINFGLAALAPWRLCRPGSTQSCRCAGWEQSRCRRRTSNLRTTSRCGWWTTPTRRRTQIWASSWTMRPAPSPRCARRGGPSCCTACRPRAGRRRWPRSTGRGGRGGRCSTAWLTSSGHCLTRSPIRR